jgi:hypothetical protein
VATQHVLLDVVFCGRFRCCDLCFSVRWELRCTYLGAVGRGRRREGDVECLIGIGHCDLVFRSGLQAVLRKRRRGFHRCLPARIGLIMVAIRSGLQDSKGFLYPIFWNSGYSITVASSFIDEWILHQM